MIEVEKKIVLTPDLLEYLATHCRYSDKKMIQDTYFDTPDYRYTSQNMWLRQREGAFELKRAVVGEDRSIDRYEEITDLKSILFALAIENHHHFSSSLVAAKIYPFASFTTLRQKYFLPDFTIDIDLADFGNFTYHIAEVECLVEHEEEIAQAEERINDFLSQFSIDLSFKPPAKLTAYLARSRPDHFKVLQNAGVL